MLGHLVPLFAQLYGGFDQFSPFEFAETLVGGVVTSKFARDGNRQRP
jgi:hypothetical protein